MVNYRPLRGVNLCTIQYPEVLPTGLWHQISPNIFLLWSRISGSVYRKNVLMVDFFRNSTSIMVQTFTTRMTQPFMCIPNLFSGSEDYKGCTNSWTCLRQKPFLLELHHHSTTQTSIQSTLL